MLPGDLVDAQVVALALGGWTTARLRTWRHRHPGILNPQGRGPRGVALFRWADVEHARAVLDRSRRVA